MSTSKKFYITTPIYYANGVPHIGHAYTSLMCDVFARMKRMLGYEVKFSTWTDENGQKMTQKAHTEGKEVMEYLDCIAMQHQQARDALSISYTDFIRTTEQRHHTFVQSMLQKTFDAGDIFQDEYEWLYCVGCEAFKKPSDLIEADGSYEWIPAGTLVCPDHPNKLLLHIKEKNWFFRLSKYQDWLEELYEKRPDFCIPSYRFNEVKSFVQQWLEDFSISREGNDFGVSIPFDAWSVAYIWFDALYNYLTVCQDDAMSFWKDAQVVQVVWKDIARFHAIFWPAMLKSSDHLPDIASWNEIVHGYFTIDGQKMSKTLWNVIDPVALTQEYGRDALVYYLFSDIKIGNDGDFSHERFLATRENVLKKWRWNLVARVVKMSQRTEVNSFDCWDIAVLKDVATKEWYDKNPLWRMFVEGFDAQVIDTYLETFDLVRYMRDWYALVQLWNKYVDEVKPWIVVKQDKEKAKKELKTLLWLVKNICLLSAPFLLEWFEKWKHIIQIQNPLRASFTTEKSSESLQQLFDLQHASLVFGKGYMY